MSNGRKDRKVPKGFVRYTGEYEKVYYDVITLNGVRLRKCWPNAGWFRASSGTHVNGDRVFALRELPWNKA